MPTAPRMNQPKGPYDFWRDTLQPGLFGLYDKWTESKPWPTIEQIKAAVANPGLLDRDAMAGYAVDMAQPFAAKLGGLLAGHMPVPAGGLFGIIAGKKAKTADLEMLDIAKQATADGLSREKVFDATGWWQGKDGEWRFEIGDSAAQGNPYPYSPQEALEDVKRDAFINDNGALRSMAHQMQPYADKTTAQLIEEYKTTGGAIVDAATQGDTALAKQLSRDRRGLDMMLGAMSNRPYGPMSAYLDHPGLSANYPDLADLHTRIAPDDLSGGVRGSYFAGNAGIGEHVLLANKPSEWSEPKSVALHELQHGIQAREGFARGGNSNMFARHLVQEKQNLEQQIGRFNEQLRDVVARKDVIAKRFDIPGKQKVKDIEELNNRYNQILDNRQQIVTRLQELEGAEGIGIQQQAFDSYKRLAGEVEARNVQKRMGLLGDDRRMLPPWLTEDTPITQQTVLERNGEDMRGLLGR